MHCKQSTLLCAYDLFYDGQNSEMRTTVYHKTNLKVVLQTWMGNYDLFLQQCTVLSVDFRVVCSAEHGRLWLCNNVNSQLVGGGGFVRGQTDYENWWGMYVLPRECICHSNGINLDLNAFDYAPTTRWERHRGNNLPNKLCWLYYIVSYILASLDGWRLRWYGDFFYAGLPFSFTVMLVSILEFIHLII